MFITLEGIEGAGKTTQIPHITQFLEGTGRSVVTTREPGSTAIGAKIRAILLDPDSKNLDYRAELLLYMADRAHHIGTFIKPALAEGKTVICDRYFDATLAYQGYARGLGVDLLNQLHTLVLDDFQPDITLLLDLPPEKGLARAWQQIDTGDRDTGETRFEQETLTFHEKVRAGYLHLAAAAPERYRIIDANADETTVRNRIINALRPVFSVTSSA